MTDYYNEIDPYAAQFLRNLIAGGHIPYGHVDTRSIEDVTPADLAGYTQCHFFAGLGGWPLALKLAGWPRDRPIWTGSCPCQPLSQAGKGLGFADERHLWPAWQFLIEQCRPPVITGEQVASKAAEAWVDLVHADMEGMDYAFGCIPFPSAGVGAPHIRDRNYWVAYADGGSGGQRGAHVRGRALGSAAESRTGPGRSGLSDGLADARSPRLAQRERVGRVHGEQSSADAREAAERGSVCAAVGMADASDQRFVEQHVRIREGAASADIPETGWSCRTDLSERLGADGGDVGSLQVPPPAGPTNGSWRDADWLACRDGKWRPVEPGTFPLAHGVSGRMGRVRADQERLASLVPRKDQGNRIGRLRGYGNAIVPEAGAQFIRAYAEARGLTLEAA